MEKTIIGIIICIFLIPLWSTKRIDITELLCPWTSTIIPSTTRHEWILAMLLLSLNIQDCLRVRILKELVWPANEGISWWRSNKHTVITKCWCLNSSDNILRETTWLSRGCLIEYWRRLLLKESSGWLVNSLKAISKRSWYFWGIYRWCCWLIKNSLGKRLLLWETSYERCWLRRACLRCKERSCCLILTKKPTHWGLSLISKQTLGCRLWEFRQVIWGGLFNAHVWFRSLDLSSALIFWRRFKSRGGKRKIAFRRI